MNDSHKYRVKLFEKIEALIQSLRIAIAKIEEEMIKPGVDIARLNKIHASLMKTLTICLRANRTLSERMNLPDTTIEEYQKFSMLPPITKEEIRGVDMTDLARKLQEEQ